LDGWPGAGFGGCGKDCVARELVKEGQDPQKVAADQLVKDGVDVLHTVGGDDTNTAAADLAAFLKKNNYNLTVIGLLTWIDIGRRRAQAKPCYI